MRIYRIAQDRKNRKSWWHGSASGDLSKAVGIHLGTYKAATEALEATIGIPSEGAWDGTRAYGETLIASKDKIVEMGKHVTGFNCGAPQDVDYYPSGTAKFRNGEIISLDSKPNIISYYIVGAMSNSTYAPTSDQRANSMMRSFKERNKARRGYYYINEGEDSGSVSAVVPYAEWLEQA